MESEREVNPNRAAGATADEAHERINSLLDCIVELTRERDAARQKAIEDHTPCREKERELATARDAWREQANADVEKLVNAIERADAAARERDEWMRSHTELGRQLNRERSAFNQRLDYATNRALDEVIAALAGWIEGARSNCLTSERCHCGGDQCGRVFHVDDIRNMIEDARRQLGAERDFDTVIDSGPDSAQQAEAFRAERDRANAAIKEVLRFVGHTQCTTNCGGTTRVVHDSQSVAQLVMTYASKQQDKARAALEVERSRAGQFERDAVVARRERDRLASEVGTLQDAVRSTLDDARTIDRLHAQLTQVANERDELRKRLERGHVCTAACTPDDHVAFLGRAELDRVTAERDRANAMVANLRSVLDSIVKSIDNQEPKP